jgi:hypothetical protein
MPTTTTRILAMSTALKTHSVGLYLAYVTVFRYMSNPPAQERLSEQIRETAVIRPAD